MRGAFPSSCHLGSCIMDKVWGIGGCYDLGYGIRLGRRCRRGMALAYVMNWEMTPASYRTPYAP